MRLVFCIISEDDSLIKGISLLIDKLKIENKTIIFSNFEELSLEKKIDFIICDDNSITISQLTSLLRKRNDLESIPKFYIFDSRQYKNSFINEFFKFKFIYPIRKPIINDELFLNLNLALDNYSTRIELKRLTLVSDQLNNSIINIALDGTLEWANEGFCKMYEQDFSSFTDKYGNNIFKSSFFESAVKPIQNCIKFKTTNTYESHWLLENSEKWIQTTLSPLLNEKGDILSVIAVESDVSLMKIKEEALYQERENLITTTEYLNNANQLLEFKKAEVEKQKALLEEEKAKSDELLLNILPFNTAEELKSKGYAVPRHYKMITVMFTDFVGFTKSCEELTPIELVNELDTYFAEFDEIVQMHHVEKIKTIGDAYMCCGGLPIRNNSNAFDMVIASLKIQKFMKQLNSFKRIAHLPVWDLRLGIHTGPVIAGVVGKKKFAYDIWGDTVNIAARMESSGEATKVNISGYTYELIKDYFDCTYRGAIDAKNKGKIDMYFVDGIKEQYRKGKKTWEPNEEFLTFISSL